MPEGFFGTGQPRYQCYLLHIEELQLGVTVRIIQSCSIKDRKSKVPERKEAQRVHASSPSCPPQWSLR
jgi:hypothetical protein